MTKEVTSLNDREAADNEKIARAFLAVYGGSMSPDATFSLRISDGEVKRYPMNGTLAPPFTTFYGLYDREASFSGQPPFDLPPRWKAAKDSIDPSLQLNGVSTADIIGGNSGSPVVNRLMDPALRQELPATELARLSAAVAGALHHVYLIAGVLALLALSLTVWLPKGTSPTQPTMK